MLRGPSRGAVKGGSCKIVTGLAQPGTGPPELRQNRPLERNNSRPIYNLHLP